MHLMQITQNYIGRNRKLSLGQSAKLQFLIKTYLFETMAQTSWLNIFLASFHYK